MQPPLQSPPKIRCSTLVNFQLPIPALLVRKIILTIITNTSLLYTSAILHLLIFAYSHLNSLHQNISLPRPFSQFRLWDRKSCDQGDRKSCENWHCFNLFLLPQSMDSDSGAHNHWFLIAHTQKSGVLQVVVSDEDPCNQNGKLSNPPSLTPSTYCYYYHTLRTP